MYTLTAWFKNMPAQRLPYITTVDIGKQLMALIGQMPTLIEMELRESESCAWKRSILSTKLARASIFLFLT